MLNRRALAGLVAAATIAPRLAPAQDLPGRRRTQDPDVVMPEPGRRA